MTCASTRAVPPLLGRSASDFLMRPGPAPARRPGSCRTSGSSGSSGSSRGSSRRRAPRPKARVVGPSAAVLVPGARHVWSRSGVAAGPTGRFGLGAYARGPAPEAFRALARPWPVMTAASNGTRGALVFATAERIQDVAFRAAQDVTVPRTSRCPGLWRRSVDWADVITEARVRVREFVLIQSPSRPGERGRGQRAAGRDHRMLTGIPKET